MGGIPDPLKYPAVLGRLVFSVPNVALGPEAYTYRQALALHEF
jgi:hypothetical protein